MRRSKSSGGSPRPRQINRDIKSLGEERRYRRPEVGSRRRLARSWAPLIQVKAARLGTALTYPGPIAHAKSCGPRTSRTLRPLRFPTPARMMSELYWDLGKRRTRRLRPGAGASIDLRRTLRRNIQYGGEFLELATQQRKDRVRPLVLICDV